MLHVKIFIVYIYVLLLNKPTKLTTKNIKKSARSADTSLVKIIIINIRVCVKDNMEIITKIID